MSAKSAQTSRPLSPFMLGPYYKPQLTSMLSITHRLTGVALSVGTIFLVAWLMAAAGGEQSYAAFSECASGWYGQIILIGFTWALSFHLCNGLRHLWWDLGRGFDLKTVYATGYAVVIVSIVLTASVWLVACCL